MVNGTQFDKVFEMIKHMQKQGIANSRNIVIGGLITPIALFWGFDLERMKPHEGSARLDLLACVRMEILVSRVMPITCDFIMVAHSCCPIPSTSIFKTGKTGYSGKKMMLVMMMRKNWRRVMMR